MRDATLLLDNIGIQHAILFQVVRDRILRQKRRLHADLSPNPFALPVRCVGRMIVWASRAELRTKCSTLNLVELLQFPPGFISDGPSDVNF